ncbi:hypothetical protein H4R19_004974, partial [Coemansia spiralis]
MKTAERLAHLSDVLTPAYAKNNADSNGHAAGGASDDNSIESLLLNLANNEMQVQQQKVQAHMPRKPTRMKLLYEDHSRPSETGRTSQLSTFNDTTVKQPASRPPLPSTLPMIPQEQKPRPRPKDDRPTGNAGLWSPARSSAQQPLSSSDASFNSSLESMREATARTEESARHRNSSSMLFGPRGMPPASSSRASSRAQDAAAAAGASTSSQLHLAPEDSYSQIGAHTSFTSLYSLSDTASTIASASRTAHEAAIAEARQMLDGIPSPTEQSNFAQHEADYLFGDSDNEEADATADGKLQSMISPASEVSARFASHASTVSSRTSAAESIASRRLATVVSTADNSLVSDTSSVGLAGQSSIGDLTNLHRSWYSSTDSLNLAGGGVVTSPVPVDDGDRDDAFAPRMVKTKSRIRPTMGVGSEADDLSSAARMTPMPASPSAANWQEYDELGSDFQRMAAISANASGHAPVPTPYLPQQQGPPLPPQQELHPHPQPHPQPQQFHHQPPYPMAAMSMQPDHNGYYAHGGYAAPAFYELNGHSPQQPMVYGANGQAYLAVQPSQQQPTHVFYDQPRASSAASVVTHMPTHPAQTSYHSPQLGTPPGQQQQHSLPPAAYGRPMSVVSAAMTNGYGKLGGATTPLPVDMGAVGRPRSHTAGSLA